jgi:excinuclease ABC subunit C
MVPSTVVPEADLAALQDALQLPGPPRHMECFDISNISATHIVASMVCFKDGVPDRASYRRYRISGVEGQNDFASMQEVVRRRYSRVLLESAQQPPAPATEPAEPTLDTSGDFSQELPAEQVARAAATRSFAAVRLPDLVIVDGGKGQLSSACKELQQLGLYDLPIIGLAKEFEEIYRPGRPVPLRLPDESGALRLLQRIRDEAHRFANGYHQLLMKRRVAESLLDDCPGVSQHRKELLLREFGSVARLKKATREQIAQVSGIGPRLAEQIATYLEERG